MSSGTPWSSLWSLRWLRCTPGWPSLDGSVAGWLLCVFPMPLLRVFKMSNFHDSINSSTMHPARLKTKTAEGVIEHLSTSDGMRINTWTGGCEHQSWFIPSLNFLTPLAWEKNKITFAVKMAFLRNLSRSNHLLNRFLLTTSCRHAGSSPNYLTYGNFNHLLAKG